MDLSVAAVVVVGPVVGQFAFGACLIVAEVYVVVEFGLDAFVAGTVVVVAEESVTPKEKSNISWVLTLSCEFYIPDEDFHLVDSFP